MGKMKIHPKIPVIVEPSVDGGFYADSIEVGYVATGDTPDQAISRFERGFVMTLQARIDRGLDTGLFDFEVKK